MRTVFLDFATLHPTDLNTQHLSDHLEQVEFWSDTTPDEMGARLAEAEAVVVNKVELRRDALKAATHLKLICLAATGSDNVDLEAAKEQGIAVVNIRDYCTASVVQHVFALLLTLNQKLDAYREQVKHGRWQNITNFCLLDPPFEELHDKTIGLVGLGSLGGGVAGVARAFGMRVIAARLPWRTAKPPGPDGQSAPRLPLEDLLQQADIVSLHCPLTDDTRHIIDANALALMQRHALLINTARGALVDSEALVKALKTGSIAGAGIDVLPAEPPVNGDPLLDYLHAEDQASPLIVTPHIAWAARQARQRALDQVLENIQAFVAGKELRRLF